MRILFTSDLHGLAEGYRGFSHALKGFDVGVIAGDLLNEYVSDQDLMRLFNLSANDFLEELPDPDDTLDDRLEAWRESPQHSYLMRGLQAREQEIKDLLREAGTPVLVVPGNHDRSALSDDELFRNIHLKRLDLDGVGFVGYGWIGSDLDPEHQMDMFGEVEPLIDGSCILVTHCPPFRVLDAADEGGVAYSIGSRRLADAVTRKRPRFHLFGHSHSSAGIRGTSVNGCYPNISHFFGIDTTAGIIWVEREERR